VRRSQHELWGSGYKKPYFGKFPGLAGMDYRDKATVDELPGDVTV
jgi:hypothetical protein